MSDRQITTTFSPDGETASVTVSGALTIEDAGEFHRACNDAVNGAQKALRLVADHLQAIDLTCLQLICSTCKTASDRRLEFTLSGELPPCLLEFCHEAGTANNIPLCCSDLQKPCILFGGVR
jgi:anti-anti-sigma regulatory factor